MPEPKETKCKDCGRYYSCEKCHRKYWHGTVDGIPRVLLPEFKLSEVRV